MTEKALPGSLLLSKWIKENGGLGFLQPRKNPANILRLIADVSRPDQARHLKDVILLYLNAGHEINKEVFTAAKEISKAAKKNLDDALVALLKEELLEYLYVGSNFCITLKGIKYLEDNSILSKRGFLSMAQRRFLSLDS